jgi:hypothetical protein
MAGPAGIVFAFEPTDYTTTKLRRNLKLNPEIARSVRVLQYLSLVLTIYHKADF